MVSSALQTPFKIDGAGFEQCALAQARFTAKVSYFSSFPRSSYH